jgi:hypothetical protein
MNNKLLLKVIIGSQAYNLSDSNSDVDYRGVFLENHDQIFGLKKAEPSHFPENKSDAIYPFKHFMSLLCNLNPNIIEMIFLKPQFNEYVHPLFKKYIIDNRDKFISKKAAKSYLGYSGHQMKLVKANNRPQYSVNNSYDGKAAMHIIRLLKQLKNIIDYNDPIVYVDDKDRIFMRNVRMGKVFPTIESFESYVKSQENLAQDHINSSSIKDTVNYDWVNSMMIEFYEDIIYKTR